MTDTTNEPARPGALGRAPVAEPTTNAMLRQFIENPYPMLSMLRGMTPVFHDPIAGRYMLLKAADVDAALRNHAYSRDPHKAAAGSLMRGLLANNTTPDDNMSMLFLDPPDHTRLRGLVSKAFTPRAVEALRPRVAAIAGGLLDAVAGEAEFDLMPAFADPLPTLVIAEMIGVDPADQKRFKAWSDVLVLSLNPFITDEDRERVRQTGEELAAYFQAVIADRRAAPRDDLTSRLIAAQEGGDRLSDEEMIITLVLLLVAGNVTTTDLIGNGVLALLENPEQLQALRDDPALIPNAVEEMLRYDPPVVETARIPLADVEIAGQTIPAGQTITPTLASANRDPAATPDPDRFDVRRENIHHWSFGGGIHFCLGAPLARLEAQEALRVLLDRYPALRPAPGSTPERKLTPGFHGLASLRVAVTDSDKPQAS
jgi:cytochrome P450